MTKYNWKEIQEFYDTGNSVADVISHYGMSSRTIFKARQNGVLTARPISEAMKILYDKRPELKLVSETAKVKISGSMKKAHAEGRAHNIGRSRWNSIPSYPEKFFMRVIENEFSDKEYSREFPFGRFSLDFAWRKKQRCIEIDGEQHQRFQDVIERDTRKDALLHNEGWQVLRIPWKEMFRDPKLWISKSYEFIHS